MRGWIGSWTSPAAQPAHHGPE